VAGSVAPLVECEAATAASTSQNGAGSRKVQGTCKKDLMLILYLIKIYRYVLKSEKKYFINH
jgi:hypothetical protein